MRWFEVEDEDEEKETGGREKNWQNKLFGKLAPKTNKKK